MRIPFPSRIPIERAGFFAFALFAVQTLEGTPLYFSAGCFVYIMIAALAFNTAGGLARTSGAYIFANAVLVLVIGVCYKAILGEPADSNLRDPHTTILVYVGSMAALFVATSIASRFSRKVGLLQGMLKEEDLFRSAVGCVIFGIAGPFLIYTVLGDSAVRVLSAFNQVNHLVDLALIMLVLYEIRQSGGTRSSSPLILAVASYIFIFFGIFGFSKQGMLTPVICWLVPVCALRYRISSTQIVGFLIGLFLVFQYLVPYVQYARRFQGDVNTVSEKVALAYKYLSHPEDTRQLYLAEFEDLSGQIHYYDTDQGFFDRLQFVAADDALIDITDQGKVFGLSPVQATFLNAIPHVFWPDKPNLNVGNLYAHEVNIISEDDTTTGVSWSPASDAYHMAKWTGVLVVAPLVWILLFVVCDSLVGDLRTTPWGLLTFIVIIHIAPEGGLSGAIGFITFGSAIVAFCAFFSAWIAPTFAIVALGKDPRKKSRPFRFTGTSPATPLPPVLGR